MVYDWQATLVFVAVLVAATVAGHVLAFKVSAFQRMRELNKAADRKKMERQRFREAVQASNRTGIVTNLVFYAAAMPFFVTLEVGSWWSPIVDTVAVLLVFDFFYYLTHRFLFHGPILRKVHALHHQARTPTYIDA